MGTARAKFQEDGAPESDAGMPKLGRREFKSKHARPGGKSGKSGMKKHKRSKRR